MLGNSRYVNLSAEIINRVQLGTLLGYLVKPNWCFSIPVLADIGKQLNGVAQKIEALMRYLSRALVKSF